MYDFYYYEECISHETPMLFPWLFHGLTSWGPAGPQSPAMGHVLMSEYREENNFPGDAYYGHYETKNMILM